MIVYLYDYIFIYNHHTQEFEKDRFLFFVQSRIRYITYTKQVSQIFTMAQ